MLLQAAFLFLLWSICYISYPDYLPLLVFMPFACDFVALPRKRWSIFSHPLTPDSAI